MACKALFIDRDGTLNRNPAQGSFIWRWEDWRFLPNAEEALHKFIRDGYIIVVISNQSGVGKGLYTVHDVEVLHKHVKDALKKRGVKIAGFYFCPHNTDDGCDCRKPKPGMILKAAKELDIDLKASIVAGDAARDIEAGRSAGTRTAFIYGDAYDDQRQPGFEAHPDFVAKDLLELHTLISRK
jgi:D-glycero-D-manno-heptose 1,7-bisphosphate phosphatase